MAQRNRGTGKRPDTGGVDWAARVRFLVERMGGVGPFCERFGVARQTVYRWQSGHTIPYRAMQMVMEPTFYAEQAKAIAADVPGVPD